jgi:hypothetical protein
MARGVSRTGGWGLPQEKKAAERRSRNTVSRRNLLVPGFWRIIFRIVFGAQGQENQDQANQDNQEGPPVDYELFEGKGDHAE